MTVQPLTQQEYRQRQILLNKVRDYWVKGVLENSLYARALIELGLQRRLDLVKQPFSGVGEFTEVSEQALPHGNNATEVFDHMEVGRTLLILGEPGSGKTITLLKLAQNLLARTETDLRQPIPVVLNLSSWARKTQTIAQWLVQELLEKYQVSKALGKTWVKMETLILLLDGLDEVKAEQRNACVQALNQFMQTHGMTELIICCRIQDYQALADRLMLRSAICIQPLTSDQINQYFDQSGDQLASLKELLRQDKELQGLATSPLMLSIMSLAYQGFNQKDIIQGGTPEDYRQRLFRTYVDRMFQRRGATQQYSRQKTQDWLIWLAQRMTIVGQTIFLIERLQPSWLLTNKQKICYRLSSSIIGGLTIGGIISMSFSLGANMVDGIAIGMFFGLNSCLIMLILRDIKPVETLKWSWQAMKNSLSSILITGCSYSLIAGFLGLLWLRGISPGPLPTDILIIGLLAWLSITLIILLAILLINGFRGSEIQQKGRSNQGIWQSVQNTVTLGLILGLVIGLIALLFGARPVGGLAAGMLAGLVGGLIGGGSACMRYFVLRLVLCKLRYSPYNYARFLDYATDRLFLQKVGGGYIFVHRMLLEYFAAMPLEQERH